MDPCGRVPASSTTCSSRGPPRSESCPAQDYPTSHTLFSTTMSFESTEACPLHRPASPAPTSDFSIIDVDVNTLPSVHYRQTYPYGEHEHDTRSHANEYGHPRTASCLSSFNTRRGFHSSPSLTLCGSTFTGLTDDTLQGSYPFDYANCVEGQYGMSDDAGRESPSNPLRTILPRIWEALSSPGKSLFPNITSPTYCPLTSVAAPCPPSTQQSSSHYGTFPRWKGKGKAKSVTPDWESEDTESLFIDYSELAPLDGEEGELIDDEACFIDIRAVTGVGESLFNFDLRRHPMRQPHCDRT